ncbi:hypothetical protein MMC18_001278 [Xylographa bjoerkii]|nr:hypothetical protein [Xylographa bjoerkii]
MALIASLHPRTSLSRPLLSIPQHPHSQRRPPTTPVSATADSEAYLFTFSGKPPGADDGFWSVTMYDNEGFLVENTENTYAVGDRSNITLLSGDLIYGSGTEDATFQVPGTEFECDSAE